jgi:PIN domain nuclease of toxin-antitoxin system
MSLESIRAVDRASQANSLFISPISAWELGVASRKKNPARRPELLGLTPEDYFRQVTKSLNVQVAPISAEIGLASSALLDLYSYSDPGDCLIMATAHVLQLTLVSRDRHILDFARRHPSYMDIVAC